MKVVNIHANDLKLGETLKSFTGGRSYFVEEAADAHVLESVCKEMRNKVEQAARLKALVDAGFISDPTPRKVRLQSQQSQQSQQQNQSDLHLNGDGMHGLKRDAFLCAYRQERGVMSRIARRLRMSRSQVYILHDKFKDQIAQIWLPVVVLLSMSLSAFAQTNPIQPTLSVGLVWQRSPDVSVVGYRIYHGPASGVYTNSVDVGNTNAVTITGLTSGMTHYFAATAYNASGESAFSNEVPYGGGAGGTNARPNLRISSYSFMLSWAAQSNVSYTLQWSTNFSNWVTYATFISGSNTTARFLVTNDVPRKTFRLREG